MLNMQRQSLGSPSSKHHLHVNGEDKKKLEVEEPNRKDGIVVEDEEEKSKVAAKLHHHHHHHHHHHRSSFRIEKSIHLIPFLMIFCFLVLYLVSHDPVQKDLVHISGFVRPSKKIDSDVDLERYLEVNKGDVIAIRSHRSLQEVERSSKKKKQFRGSRSVYRKFGDF